MPTFSRKMLMSSLLDNINRLTQNTDSKLIFKTELNSLEITRLKPPPYTHQIGTDFATEFSLIPEGSVQFLENPEFPDSSSPHPDHSALHPDSPTQSPDSSSFIHDSPTVVADSTSNRSPRYTCHKCNYTTQKKSNYTTHLKCVHLKEKFPCGICHRLFSNLPQHMRVAHATTQGKLLNEKIRENISEDLGLKSHLALVPSTAVITSGYSCKLCSQQFATKSDLSLHRKTHKANIKRECGICKKLYSNLEQHVKIVHRKIKNFECVNCRKRFYDNRELRNHHLKSLQTGQCQTISTDQGGKRFPCDQCEYKSKTKTNLTLHIESIHLGIKYTCPACFTQVSSRPNLNSHMKHCKLRDNGERESRRILFQCKLCEYSTPRAGHLDRHILSVHGTEALETVTSVYEASTKIGSTPAPTHPSCKIPFKLPQFFNLVNLENIEGLLDMDSYNTEFMSSNVHLQSPDGSGFQSTEYLNSSEHSNGIQDDFSERTSDNYILTGDLETPRSDPNFLHPAGDGLGEEGVGHHNMEEVQPAVDISTHRPLKISLQDLDGLELMPLIPDGETETEKSSPSQSTIRPVVSSPEFILQEVDQTGFRDHHPTFQSGLQVTSLSSTEPSGQTSQIEDLNSEAACNPGLVVLNIRSISSLEDANKISVPVLGNMTRMSVPAMKDATGRSVPAMEDVTIRSVHALEDVTGRSVLSMEDATERSAQAMEVVALTSVSSMEDMTERVIPTVEVLQRVPSPLDGDYSSRVSNQTFLYEI